MSSRRPNGLHRLVLSQLQRVQLHGTQVVSHVQETDPYSLRWFVTCRGDLRRLLQQRAIPTQPVAFEIVLSFPVPLSIALSFRLQSLVSLSLVVRDSGDALLRPVQRAETLCG